MVAFVFRETERCTKKLEGYYFFPFAFHDGRFLFREPDFSMQKKALIKKGNENMQQPRRIS
ncbi:hypothetical protein ACJX0J_010958, partial [Zea mays]